MSIYNTNKVPKIIIIIIIVCLCMFKNRYVIGYNVLQPMHKFNYKIELQK